MNRATRIDQLIPYPSLDAGDSDDSDEDDVHPTTSATIADVAHGVLIEGMKRREDHLKHEVGYRNRRYETVIKDPSMLHADAMLTGILLGLHAAVEIAREFEGQQAAALPDEIVPFDEASAL